jgi:hypothetical protein
MRTPISCVRSRTEYAITPYTPTAGSASATMAKTPTSQEIARGRDTVLPTTSSTSSRQPRPHRIESAEAAPRRRFRVLAGEAALVTLSSSSAGRAAISRSSSRSADPNRMTFASLRSSRPSAVMVKTL